MDKKTPYTAGEYTVSVVEIPYTTERYVYFAGNRKASFKYEKNIRNMKYVCCK